MKKVSTLSILILAVCAFCLILMRTCGGTEVPPTATAAPEQVTVQPTEPAVEETPTPTVPLTTPEPAEIELWVTSDLNLRRTADGNADILLVIPKDAKIRRLDFPSGGWVHVKYEESEGYVSEAYVSRTDPALAAPAVSAEPGTPVSAAPEESGFTVTPCNDVVYTTDGVNLRRGPGKEYDVAVSVNKDTKLQRTGTTENGWSRVLFESVGYFVSSEFVTTAAPEGAVSENSENAAAPASTLGSVAESGEFKSDTGVALNVLVRWNTVHNSDGSLTLNLSAVLLSGPLTAAQYADNLCFRVGNDTFNKTAPAISLSDNTVTETPLGSQSVKVSPGSVPVSVSWTFKGTYSGQEIEKVTASQTLVLR